ncbi:carbohydrate ABC transporter permease [Corynebacterium jeddahense]|uniref:Sn-glycerol-3-phosphate transport system permease protein UgpA n=1 Tax=Corynebacterium jeddahense TaxID=1414719 RepID=A0ABY7UN56_9CORY|nr:sugar ABC transporter permease [Corynebacterium jeddahense]WCZ39844.1 sn-glycerol-3-phosphate transport system permease protein UgpA [Corynebacterium jeddahense]
MNTMIPAISAEPVVSEEYAATHKKRRSKTDWRQVGLATLLIGPNLLLLILFTYRPLIDNIRISFYNWNISSPTMTFVGLQNYLDWFHAPETPTVVWNTVLFTFFAVAGSMVIGLALAILLDQKLFGRAAVRSMVFAPYVIAGAAIGVAFQFVFDPRYGLIQYFLGLMHIPVPNFYQRSGWALFMVTVTYIWKNVGYVFVIYLAALQGRRADLDEASEIDGTPPARHFFRVVLPQLRGTTFFLLITVLLNSFQVFDVINAMTRGGPFTYGTTTMVFQVYTETFVNNRAGYGAAVATIMFVVVLIITVLQIKLQERLDK